MSAKHRTGRTPDDYEAPRWVHVGMPVWSPCDVGVDAFGRSVALSTLALRCVVTVATGDFARVENETHEYTKLMPLSELRVPKRPDPADPYLCLSEAATPKAETDLAAIFTPWKARR